MSCPKCQRSNPAGARFCEECGAELSSSCPRCGTALSLHARFCPGCGQLLQQAQRPASRPDGLPPAAEESPAADESGEGERRHLTVMFCDLVESTALAAQLDPEDFRDLIRAYQKACATVVERYNGSVAQYLGDGLLVFFGYPLAHEDDARRAVHAALEVLEALRLLNTRFEHAPATRLSARIGIHSGPAVVGRRGGGQGSEEQVFGHTMNLAARLQAVAEPDSVVISEQTLRLVSQQFITRDLGTVSLKGIANPVSLHQVVEVRNTRHVSAELGAAMRSQFVGRAREIELLLDRWEQVNEGLGQVVHLSGEAGIGKSRLVETFRTRIAAEASVWLQCLCSAYHDNSALYPMADLLEQGLGLVSDDLPEGKIARIEESLQEAGLPVADLIPFLASLLSLPLPQRYASPPLSAEARRRRTLEALLRWMLGLAAGRPAVLVVEDLQWADPSTLELLGMLVDQAPTVSLLLLLTFRSGFELPWAGRSHVARLTLQPLTRKQVAAMVEGVARGRRLPTEVLKQVVAKTDGVPLFVEELTKTVLESGLLQQRNQHYEMSGRRVDFAIPSTLQDSLMARLDRLGPAKEVAQLGAVLGREFTHELLESISEHSSATLESALARLAGAELLYRRGVPPMATYIFRHALIQDAAYLSLLKSQRRQFHSRVARILEEKFPDRVVSEPGVIAKHCEEAGLAAEAVSYYRRAGWQASQRSAYAEAVGHLTKGLEVLNNLPQGGKRDRLELDLRIAIGTPLIAMKGYGDPEVERAYARARKLCEQIDDKPQLFESLWGLANYYQVRSQFAAALESAQQLISIAERAEERSLLVWAHLQVGGALFWRGKPRPAAEHLEQAVEQYHVADHWLREGASDPGVASRVYGALVLWQLGHVDKAMQRSREGVELSRSLAHPFTLALALCFTAVLHQLRGDPEAVRLAAGEVIELATEQEFPVWRAMGKVMSGWALARSEGGGRGVEEIQKGMASLAETRTEIGAPGGLMLLADANRAAGRKAEALALLEAALATAGEKDQRYWDAEIHRVKGEMLVEIDPGAETEAESCFRTAIALSQGQGSKSFELRAAMSLGQLLCKRGKSSEARALLAPVYQWFKEGKESRDLLAARKMLGKLS